MCSAFLSPSSWGLNLWALRQLIARPQKQRYGKEAAFWIDKERLPLPLLSWHYLFNHLLTETVGDVMWWGPSY